MPTQVVFKNIDPSDSITEYCEQKAGKIFRFSMIKANEPITRVVLSKDDENNFVATVNMESAVSHQRFSARESSDDIYFAIFNVFKKLKTKLDHYKLEKRKQMLSLL